MALKLRKFCRKSGCKELVTSGYCDKHKPESYMRYDRHRGTPSERGYGSRWRRYSKWFLRQHPLCMCDECKQRVVPLPSEHTDHVIPVSGPDDPLFWDPDNHQALSASCHSKKTVREDGGFGR